MVSAAETHTGTERKKTLNKTERKHFTDPEVLHECFVFSYIFFVLIFALSVLWPLGLNDSL